MIMKKALSVLILLTTLLSLCACSRSTPSIVGNWESTSSLLGVECNELPITTIFYDGITGEEYHKKDDALSKYQFDYELNGDVLTIYVGSVTTDYKVVFSEQNGAETMQLTAEDGTVYVYTLTSRNTPGIHS